MEQTQATQAFATLGHSGRMAVFRLLMRFAPQGVRPTEIAKALGMKQNTLSHHLADLSASGLVQVTRVGRSLNYAVDLGTTESLIGYLALDVGRARPDLLVPLLSAPKEAAKMDVNIPDTDFDVLFICSGNSARSILAEAVLNREGKGRFVAYSAGSRPSGHPHPLAISLLQREGIDTSFARSKSWDEFATPDAPKMDFVFTVCDNAAAEECPYWPGQPMTAHWGLPDPAAATGTDAEKAVAFASTYASLARRIQAFCALPLATIDALSLKSHLKNIGENIQ